MSSDLAENKTKTPPTVEEIRRATELLLRYTSDPVAFAALPKEDTLALMIAAGRLSRPAKFESVRRNRELTKDRKKKIAAEDRAARAVTGIREARLSPVFIAPKQIEVGTANGSENRENGKEERVLHSPRRCYICKEEFTKLHFFYDSMCPKCAAFNYAKRFQTAPLDGRTALITGARLKIGYYSALMMLRAGARVVVTTRFPVDAAARFSKEEDFSKWGSRLEVYGLDLRHTPSVELFCRFMENHLDRLDILINNAAQTVRRPPGFYAHLMEHENLPFHKHSEAVQKILSSYEDCKKQLGAHQAAASDAALPVAWHGQGQGPGIGLRASAKLSLIPYSYDNSLATDEVFPLGKLDADLQQVDLRKMNSWRLKLADVPTPEMLEVQLVNAVAPFVLCSRLAPLMRRDNTGQKHIVNVTAMEGKFLRFMKGDRHPHTNMAKAALNMLTHTSSTDLAEDGIFMNAVDTGWVTDEDPAQLAQAKAEMHDFQPPLDIVDGAARVCDPFFDGILTGKHWCGKFLKDYFPIDW